MKRSSITIRTLEALLLSGGCLAGVLALTVARHAPLVAYGLESPTRIAYGFVAGFATLAAVCLNLVVCVHRGRCARWWVLAIAAPVWLLVALLSFLGVYSLEFKYEKGESNLRRLAVYCRTLPEWQSRVSQLRGGILRNAGLDPMPKRTPLNPIIHGLKTRDGYAVENVSLETIPGFFLAGNLYRPLSIAPGNKAPAVIIPQGHFPKGRFNEETQRLAATLARMGAFAFLYDMAGRGETTQVTHGDPHALTMQLWDSMRVLDFLLASPEVDAARVGMTGASGGGTQTFLCTAVDPRVTVSAPVVMVSSWMYGGCACESGLPIHGTPKYRTNNAEIAAMAAPRPQLIVSIDEDWTRTVPEREFPYIRGIYRLYNAEDRVRNVHLAGEHHDFGPSKRDALYRFFAEHLGLALDRVTRPDGSIDESAVTVEPEEALHAFDTEHPRPLNALRGWDAVMAVFASLQRN